MTNNIYPLGGRLQHAICIQNWCHATHQNTPKMVQNHSKLDWNNILWPCTALALLHHKSNLICWHLHTWLHQEVPPQVQTPPPKKPTKLTASCLTTTVWPQIAGITTSRCFPQTCQGRQKQPTVNCGLYPRLCLGSQQHGAKSIQHHHMTQCKCNKTYQTMGPSTSWLPHHPSHCNCLLLGERQGAQSA